MKYTRSEALSEILRRSDQIALRRQKQTCGALSGASAMLCAALVLLIALLPGRCAAAATGTAYGAFLLSAQAGGYVLAAVIAFTLGVVVTLLCVKRKMTDTGASFAETHHKNEEENR